MTVEDGFKNLLAVHRVFGSGSFENLDGGTEERHALDGLIGFVGGVDDVLVFLVFLSCHLNIIDWLGQDHSPIRCFPARKYFLPNLAPDIVEEIMRDPPAFNFSVKKIFSHRLPADWNEQRKFLGLPEKDYMAK